MDARALAGDLSDVAGDLVDDETLAREREEAAKRADTSVATRQRALGIGFLAGAGLQGFAAGLLFAGRRRRTVAALVALSLLPGIATMALSGASLPRAVAIALPAAVLAIVLSCLRHPATGDR